MVSYYLVQGWQVSRIELFGGARVGTVGGAARCDKEGAAADGAPEGATLVDGHGDEPIHDMVTANGAAIY